MVGDWLSDAHTAWVFQWARETQMLFRLSEVGIVNGIDIIIDTIDNIYSNINVDSWYLYLFTPTFKIINVIVEVYPW